MPARLLVQRCTAAAFAGVLCLSAPLSAAPLGPVDAPAATGGVTLVENRLLPRWLGGERQPQRVELPPDNTAVRLDQLETQVRNLTGQVEQLTFALRRLEAAMADGGPPRGATPGAATLPRTVEVPTASRTVPPVSSGGPVDLSALNRGTVPAQPVRTEPPVPADNDALSRVRSLYQTGRYAMAQQEAETVLSGNPSGPVAGEARFILGEALLAQGEYREAANQFLENYTSDPNGARAPASLLKLGTSLNGLGEREAACSSLEELFNVYPNVDGQLRADAERERQAANCA